MPLRHLAQIGMKSVIAYSGHQGLHLAYHPLSAIEKAQPLTGSAMAIALA
jgi:hypothetical protein